MRISDSRLDSHIVPEILRRSAENTMHSLVRKVFSRLHSLDPEEEEAKLVVPEAENESETLKMTVTSDEPDTSKPAQVTEGDGADSEVPPQDESAEPEPQREPEEQPSLEEEETPQSPVKRPECKSDKLAVRSSSHEIRRRFAFHSGATEGSGERPRS